MVGRAGDVMAPEVDEVGGGKRTVADVVDGGFVEGEGEVA